MYFEVTIGNDLAQQRIREDERCAAENWRFRHLEPKGVQMLTTVLLSLGSVMVAAGQWLTARGASNAALSS
jgi:hypothetical protein